MSMLQALLVVGFISVHLFAGNLRFLDCIPRSRWLSWAGGTSVAYVFLHVFPELQEVQGSFGEWPILSAIEHHAYVVALFGLAAFYGLERLVKSSQRRQRKAPGSDDGETTTGIGVFWLHVTSFAVYNALIGYLLAHRGEEGSRGLIMFFVAMALHFLVNDYGLRQDHKTAYRRVGRWILSMAIAAGWMIGLVTEISTAATGTLFAFLAGGVVLNVLKEELPEERQSRFLPFALGAASYAFLLLIE